VAGGFRPGWRCRGWRGEGDKWGGAYGAIDKRGRVFHCFVR
jgi:hypothetical protein